MAGFSATGYVLTSGDVNPCKPICVAEATWATMLAMGAPNGGFVVPCMDSSKQNLRR